MHVTSGVRDPGQRFILPTVTDDAEERRQANRALGVSAAGLALTGVVELAIAVLTGSVGLLGDALHNLSDVSTSALVFLGFRVSKKDPTERYPYGFERAEDLAGVGIAVVIWASALFAGVESVRKLLGHGHTTHVGVGMAAAALGIIGNQVVARTSWLSASGSTPPRWSRTRGTPGWTHCPRPGRWSAWSLSRSGCAGVTQSLGWRSPRSSPTWAGRSAATSGTG